MVEHQPSKLRVAGSNPVSRSSDSNELGKGCDETHPERGGGFQRAHVAQSVEHFLGKEEVTGSNPVMGSTESADSQAERDLARPRQQKTRSTGR